MYVKWRTVSVENYMLPIMKFLAMQINVRLMVFLGIKAIDWYEHVASVYCKKSTRNEIYFLLLFTLFSELRYRTDFKTSLCATTTN